MAHKHLSQQKIDPLLYMTEWFMCAFSRTLPWSSVLRVWDMFFCEGTGLARSSSPAPSPAHGGLCLQRDSPEQPPLPALTACSPTGVKIIFRVGLVLLKHALGSPEKVKSCQGQYETIERLRSLSPKVMQEAFLVQEVWPPVPLTPEMGGLTVTLAPHPRREGEPEGPGGGPRPYAQQPRTVWTDLVLLSERGEGAQRGPDPPRGNESRCGPPPVTALVYFPVFLLWIFVSGAVVR